MATNRLIFSAPPLTALPARLVFGEDAGGTPEPPANVTVLLAARITRLRCSAAVHYESRTQRPTVGGARARWQVAAPARTGLRGEWQAARALQTWRIAEWQQAAPLPHALVGAWQDARRTARAHAAVRFERGLPVGGRMFAAWQQAVRQRASAATRYEEAAHTAAWPVAVTFEQSLRRPRLTTDAYQAGTPRRASVVERESDALASRTPQRARYQQARRPPIGRWVRPSPPAPLPCYTPGLPVQLVFSAAGTDGALPRLVFLCDRLGPPQPGGTVVVPIRRVYVTINSLTLQRASDGALIPCAAFGMDLDAGSWTWSWQATLHADALPLITPVGGEPVQLLATINGTPFALAAESYTRQRQFANTRISARGRGKAAVLDAPYAPTLNFGNAAARTAQQLANESLMINGVPIGWAVDWGLTDWLVPGGAWSQQGSYISAILDIAGAAGGYVQPHDTAQTLRILPRYPAAPWEWASLTPDYELPAAAIAIEGTEWLQKPGYTRVHVAGTHAGVLGQVTRAGTAGDAVAPMVTHPLITHADAARQRGIAELSDTGRQAHLSLRMPVLNETGIIKPGALVRYVDAGVPTLGLVRGTQIDWSRPTLRQVLAVETHPEVA